MASFADAARMVTAVSSTAPLGRHPLTRTTDLDEARAGVADQFCAHQLTLIGPGPVDLVHNGSWIGQDVGVNYIRYGAAVRIVPRDMTDFLLLQLPLSGRAVVEAQGTRIATHRRQGSLLTPGDGADLRFGAGYEQLVVYFRRSAIEAAAGTVAIPRAVHFRPEVPLDSPAVRNLARLIQFAVEDLDAGRPSISSADATRSLEQTMVHALLGAQANSTWGREVVLSSRAVRAALELMERDPAADWSVSDLATGAGVAPRTLQESFRRELGSSPMEQLRRTRLRRAHDDLARASGGELTVAAVAARWGMHHLGRFSRAYHSTYGELPSQTLAR